MFKDKKIYFQPLKDIWLWTQDLNHLRKFVTPQKPLIDIFLVIKVIISYDNFIAIDPMKKFGTRFSFSDFHGQKFSLQREPGLREQITENMINI